MAPQPQSGVKKSEIRSCVSRFYQNHIGRENETTPARAASL